MGQLPRYSRITTRREITRLLNGSRVRGTELELYWLPAERENPRATCITPRYRGSAVRRNRLRRRLKELMRSLLLTRPEGRDYLVRARPDAYELDFDGLAAALGALVGRMAGKTVCGDPPGEGR